ncbi:hypothetical protein JCM1840_000632 [Sporobolomyces johnsonii]
MSADITMVGATATTSTTTSSHSTSTQRTRLEYTGVAGADWYLMGVIKCDAYTAARMPEVRKDPVKQKDYTWWVKLADAVKLAITTYRGPDAEPQVEMGAE